MLPPEMLPLEMLPSEMLQSEMPPPEMPAAQSSNRRQKLPLSPPLLKRGESLKRMDRPRRPSSSEMLVRLGKALVHRGATAAQEGRPRAAAGSSDNKPSSRNRRCRAVVARGGGREGRVEMLRGRCL